MSERCATIYSDPCRECAFSWSLPDAEAQVVIAQAAGRFGALLDGGDGSSRTPGLAWDARTYVWHVADNIRIWAERLAGMVAAGTTPVVPYDQDRLAQVRGYDRMPLTSALWSLRRSSEQWAVMWPEAPVDGRLLHRQFGALDKRAALRQVAHDTVHHQYDVSRSL